MKRDSCHDPVHGPLSRRDTLKAGALLAAGAMLPSGCASLSKAPAASSERPRNIVLFLTDDQSWRSTGYASGGRVHTPHLDRAASRGMVFQSAYCSSMPCIPSRAGIMTGLHEHRWERQKLGLLEGLKEGSWTWAHALRRAGYRTALVGKMHFQPMRSRHGFDFARYCENKLNWEWRAENDYYDDHQLWMAEHGLVQLPDEQPEGVHADKVTAPIAQEDKLFSWPFDVKYHAISYCRDQAIEFLKRQRTSRRPYCLLVSIKHPHSPFVPGKPFDRLYDPRSFDLPVDRWEAMRNMPPSLRELGRQKGEWIFAREDFSEEHLRKLLAAYHGLVSQIDEAVGEILRHVDLRNTTCFYTSDHGDYLGHRGRMFKSPLIPLDDIAKVPFVAWGAGVPRGVVCDAPVSFVDLAPTFLATAGEDAPADLDGVPLQRYFNNPGYEAERPVYCYGRDGFDMVRRNQWKCLRSHDGSEHMLFNLREDPDELDNRSADPGHATQLARLSQEMDRVLGRGAAKLPRFNENSDIVPAGA